MASSNSEQPDHCLAQDTLYGVGRVYQQTVTDTLRWTPPVGQFGGLDKLGSGCRQAASLSISGAQYASSGERPASVE
jgi:hypothetical protein